MDFTTTFGSGEILLFMLEFFLFIIWFWLLIAIFGDLFRDSETGGGVKALWVVFLILLPFLGILLYLIVRGKGMGTRQADADAGRAGGVRRPDPQRDLVVVACRPDREGQGAARLGRDRPGRVRQAQGCGPGLRAGETQRGRAP